MRNQTNGLVNLRSNLRSLRVLRTRREAACLNVDGEVQASVFTLGEYNRMLAEGYCSDEIATEQRARRTRLWSSSDERRYQRLVRLTTPN